MNIRYLAIMATLTLLSVGCATIVNDPNIPLSFSFSDGSSGKCELKNKRGTWSADLPATNVLIRRSDDALVYNCTTEDGREVSGSIRSETEGGKLAASVLFWDFGITDSITDKHRTYQGNVVIPVTKVSGNADGEEPNGTGQSDTALDPLGMSVGGDEESDAAVPDQSSNEPQ